MCNNDLARQFRDFGVGLIGIGAGLGLFVFGIFAASVLLGLVFGQW